MGPGLTKKFAINTFSLFVHIFETFKNNKNREVLAKENFCEKVWTVGVK